MFHSYMLNEGMIYFMETPIQMDDDWGKTLFYRRFIMETPIQMDYL